MMQRDLASPDAARAALRADYLADEAGMMARLLPEAGFDDAGGRRVAGHAHAMIEALRAQPVTGLDALLREYDLSSQEGVMLMCLAEALLRIPDAATADRLIRDKLAAADWRAHLGQTSSWLVNAATWGLMLTGRLVDVDDRDDDAGAWLQRLAARLGEPVARAAIAQAMRVLGGQFVMGEDIAAAVARSRTGGGERWRYSYDMLGETALTSADAERYVDSYLNAIEAIGAGARADDPYAAPSLSIKLSALHPRLELAQRGRVMKELLPRLLRLLAAARRHGIMVSLDAEEADRLEIGLDVFEAAWHDPVGAGWNGLGMVVQCYQKRAPALLEHLFTLARATGRRLPLRLVKGAYWDSEIKRAQERGLDDYPVYTRKTHTDVAYLACARRALAQAELCYPQFATHNAWSVAAIVELAGDRRFEFQRLHGMGEPLYAALAATHPHIPCRVYAPVGRHAELLPYLVRRLLENGANSSFVNRLYDARLPPDALSRDPAARVRAQGGHAHPRIPRPPELYRPGRGNSPGINLQDPAVLRALQADLGGAARPQRAGVAGAGPARVVTNPARHSEPIGEVTDTDPARAESALAQAAAGARDWDAVGADRRAAILERAAELLEADRAGLLSLCIREGGRCLPDAVAEWREAIDYCRYYAAQARRDFGTAGLVLPGPTGEDNRLRLHGRGVFLCISPWNFPLAIFTGQVVAALAAGNAALAKPATATPLIAARVTELLYRAGVPREVLQLLPGPGASLGGRLAADPRVDGVVFTGSIASARDIQRRLAARPGGIATLIAETGGQNAMIVDSSALPEQVVIDVINSAFNSAGQRCSALRVLFVQDEIADRVLTLLAGAMDELRIGDPARLDTDIGPVIDARARAGLEAEIARLRREARLVHALSVPADCADGHYVGPCVFEIGAMEMLQEEIFGPVLHVVRYAGNRLDAVVAAINASGYGLTLGIHTRIEARARDIAARVRAGNIYINRNMIGAVVGVQPFGGEGLSGTGPKAGGPHYLHRFATERVVTTNTAAVGGNAGLLALDDD